MVNFTPLLVLSFSTATAQLTQIWPDGLKYTVHDYYPDEPSEERLLEQRRPPPVLRQRDGVNAYFRALTLGDHARLFEHKFDLIGTGFVILI